MKEYDSPAEGHRRGDELKRATVLVAFSKAMLAVNGNRALKPLVDHLTGNDFGSVNNLSPYNLTMIQLQAIFELKPSASQVAAPPPLKTWLSTCRKQLKELTTVAPQPPPDFRRASDTDCSCSDCRTLSKFLADPVSKTIRLPLAKQRRQHLHNMINSKRLDCTHVTEHIGSPHVLVCTKTSTSFDAADKIYHRDVANLTKIEAFLSN